MLLYKSNVNDGLTCFLRRKRKSMNLLNILVTVLVASALVACGGGSDGPAPTAPTPAPVPPVAVVPEADVTFRPYSQSAYRVQPGRDVDVLFAVDCKGVTAEGYCPGQWTEIGGILIQSSIELTSASFKWSDGTEVEGEFRSEGSGKYRFIPEDTNYIWRRDEFIVEVEVSPYARAGNYTLVILEVDSPSPNKTIKADSATATFKVYESADIAPMSIRASAAYQPIMFRDNVPFVEYTISAECAQDTACEFDIDFTDLPGFEPGSWISICHVQSGYCWGEEAVDDDGELDYYFESSQLAGAGDYLIRLVPDAVHVASGQKPALFARKVKSNVDYVRVFPKLGTFTEPETGCTVVTPSLCKD
jgi:hypothetical protein